MINGLQNYRLRYYYCEDLVKDCSRRLDDFLCREHELVLNLLEQIKQRVGIEYELYPFRTGQEELIYEEHFKKRNRLLNKIHDLTVSEALKSRSGNIHLHGVIALVKNGQVVWYSAAWTRDNELWRKASEELKNKLGLPFVSYDIAFLKVALENPQYLLDIANYVEHVLRGQAKPARPTHDELVLKTVRMMLREFPDSAIFVEMPLGV